MRRKTWIWYALLIACSVLLQCVTPLYEKLEESGLILYLLHPWLFTGILALAGPFLLARFREIPPILVFFPPGLALLMNRAYPDAAPALLWMAVSLLCACIGDELRKRRMKRNCGQHGKHAGKH